jgi:hypothetical protein
MIEVWWCLVRDLSKILVRIEEPCTQAMQLNELNSIHERTIPVSKHTISACFVLKACFDDP